MLDVSSAMCKPVTHFERNSRGVRKMATFRKMPSGGYRAEVARQGVRRSKVFPTKTAAKEWAAREEYLILNADEIRVKDTFASVLRRYSRERTPGKRGARWEMLRLERLAKDAIGKKSMQDLTAKDFAEWRDRRMTEVSPGSVIREMNLLSAVLTVSVKEWRLMTANPLSDVRRPTKPQPRDRIPTQDEMDRLAVSAGSDLTNATARAYQAFLFAIETGMRAGEIVGLTPSCIDTKRRVARLEATKNGTSRDVPLSSEAIRIIESLPPCDPVFDLTSRQLDALWRKLRDRASVTGLTFHDSRHAAITRLSKKLDVLALAKMVGHRDIRMLQVYYDESAEELAKRLD